MDNPDKASSNFTLLPHNRSFVTQKNDLPHPRSSGFLHEYAVHEINALLWALLIVATGMLLKRVFQLVCLWLKGSRLPGPPSPTFTGHASCITKAGGPDGFTGFLNKLHQSYGPVVRLWLGPAQLLVSVRDPDLISKLLLNALDRVPATGKALQLAFGRSSLFTASMDQAKRRRPVLCEEFNGQLISRVHSACQRVIGQLDIWAKEVSGGWELDSRSSSQHIAFMVLGTTLFGDSFVTWSGVDEFEKLLLLISKEACFWATYSVMPFWNKNFQRYKYNCLRLRSLTEEIIGKSREQHEHLQAHECGNTTCSESCLKTVYSGIAGKFGVTGANLSEDLISGVIVAQNLCGPYQSNEELRGSLIGMMFHGTLTTAGIVSDTLTRLAHHPVIQAKVHSEIDKICDGRSIPTVDNIQKMHYLMATLHESARLLPSGPFLQRCSLLQDLKLSSTVTVPAGAIIAVPVQLVQMDSCQWGSDAELFKPERFLCRDLSCSPKSCAPPEESFSLEGQMEGTELDDDVNAKKIWLNESKDADVTVNGRGFVFKDLNANPSFLLFGAGSRACIGKNFAINEIMTILATLLQRYKIKLGRGGGKDLKPRIENCVLQLSPSSKLIFEPRNRH